MLSVILNIFHTFFDHPFCDFDQVYFCLDSTLYGPCITQLRAQHSLE